jgi:serine/threonine protein kinase
MLGVITRDNPAYLLLEFMDKGDLKEFLINHRSGEFKRELSEERFYQMAAQIADGMLWLSEHKYIHRDLAARNCLISKDDVIKIAGNKNIHYPRSIFKLKLTLLNILAF